MTSLYIFTISLLILIVAIAILLRNLVKRIKEFKKIIDPETKENTILDFLKTNQKITNNDVEKLLKVSDSTATRYLDNLEKAGKIVQVGPEGRAVYYRLK